MKKILLSALGAVMLLVTSCQKSDLATGGDASGDLVNISVALGDVDSSTRAIDDYGNATEVKRCILEIYDIDGDLYKRIVEPIVETNGVYGADFSLRLVATGDAYTYVAWADYVEKSSDLDADYYYDTQNGLDEIEIIKSGNSINDYKDAFFATKVTTDLTVDMELTRPFGQLNVLTKMTDVDPSLQKYYPKSVKVKYADQKYFTKFNAKDDKLTVDNSSCTYNNKTIETTVDANGYIHLTTDYIFAPNTNNGEETIDFVMTFYSDNSFTDKITTNSNFINIPIKRNYRTNVYGELLTEEGQINVTIDPGFDGDIVTNM